MSAGYKFGYVQATYPTSIVDPEWEKIDPHPNIDVLFDQFDATFFGSKLRSHVKVRWSKPMKSRVGSCRRHEKTGYYVISLSWPLLELRSRRDIVESLLVSFFLLWTYLMPLLT